MERKIKTQKQAETSRRTALPRLPTTQRARRSALWLGEDILRRSVPLPGKMRLRG